MSTSAIPSPHTQVIPAAQNLFKASVLLALLFTSFFAADRIVESLDRTTVLPAAAAVSLTWAAVLALASIDFVLITGLGVLAHDAVHRVLFRSPFWNELFGGLLSAFVLVPFYANRQFHLTHHSYAHQPGLDPENTQHNHSFLYAATVGSVIALQEQYRILFSNLLRIHDRRYTARVLKDLGFVAFGVAVYGALLPALGISLAVTLLPVLLVFPPLFAFRALSDHYGIPPIVRETKKREDVLDADEETWHADRERRQREISGWVVLTAPWLEWLWSHVNYHEVHHKYPYLSHRYLPEVFAATRDRHPYLVVNGYCRSLFNLRRRAYYGAP
ncbi:MAG TPA: fatty acid desaturase [Burkholderiales bacterium]|nr:fatty acid desaturase [Burkholderiales bacterium]